MTLELPLFGKDADYWKELESVLTEDIDKEQVKKAYDFAYRAHLGQKRESGEPYISHPIWVAKTVAQLGAGEEAVIASILHDCVEDTSTTLDNIAEDFGDEVALLVEGMTEVKRKDKGVIFHETNIEVFRQFLFSSVNDVRVLIIRIVDKLHNGLTLTNLSRERQIKYAHRVFGVYGPVAEYVGLHYFKRLLEDIAFKVLYPDEANKIADLIESQANEEVNAEKEIKKEIEKMVTINNIHNIKIESRIKSLYSSYQKVKNKGWDRLKDRVGIRILANSITDCYSILGLLHSKYQYLPEDFNDYISSPKPNGYRSIQTTLSWKDKLTVEVQIRTYEMHEFNEFGPASHIAYKLGKNKCDGMGMEWVKDLVNWQKSNNKISNYRINVLDKFVYVFTPKGDTIQLPKGSTALDFAYRLHTAIGDKCNGVKINLKMAKIGDKLKTGDFVEILTTNKKNVNINWLEQVSTTLAKDHIRRKTMEKNDKI